MLEPDIPVVCSLIEQDKTSSAHYIVMYSIFCIHNIAYFIYVCHFSKKDFAKKDTYPNTGHTGHIFICHRCNTLYKKSQDWQ